MKHIQEDNSLVRRSVPKNKIPPCLEKIWTDGGGERRRWKKRY